MDVVRPTRFGNMRKRVNKRRSKRMFSRSANATRSENMYTGAMRGGRRL